MVVRFVDDEYVWNIPLEKAKNSQFLQSWWWGVFQQTCGRKAWRLQVVDGDEPIAALQCLAHTLPGGRQYLYAPHGPVFFTDDTSLYETIVQDLYRGLKQILDQEKFVFARIEPVANNLDFQLFSPLGFYETKSVQPQDELAAIVTGEEEEILGAMHEKTRYNIRLATKHDVKARLIETPDYARRVLPMFWEMINATANRQKIRLHEREYYQRMAELFVKRGSMKLLIADFENTIIASHLLWVFGDTVYFLHGGSDYEHRNLMAPFALHWEGIRLAKKLGKTYYNFGGKMGETGERFHYPGGLDLVFQPLWYRMYTAARSARGALRFR
jgi:peptidoglycan pentaglycine glycine transferase (the first glycine)